MMLAASYTSSVLLNAGPLEGSGGTLVGEIARAGIWTLFLALATGVKMLDWRGDPMLAELRDTRTLLSHNARELIDAATVAYERVLSEIEREKSPEVARRAAEIAQELARATIALTRRAHELHDSLKQLEQRPLDRRARELEERARAARDPALKHELLAVLAEIVEQMHTRSRLEAATVRLEARAQRYVTALERLHITLVKSDSLNDSDHAAHSALDDLIRLTEEVRWQNLSVDDLIGPEEQREEQPGGPQLDDFLSQIESLNLPTRDEIKADAEKTTSAPPQVEPEPPRVVLTTPTDDEPVVFQSADARADEPSTADGTDGSIDEAQQEQQAHVRRER
jgi:hypothetical protein